MERMMIRRRMWEVAGGLCTLRCNAVYDEFMILNDMTGLEYDTHDR